VQQSYPNITTGKAYKLDPKLADRVLQLEEEMFNWRSRHLILVLTLGYKPECQSYVTLGTIQADRDTLLNNRRSNRLLAGINGYVWKIEEGGRGGGLHMHLVLFYSSEHRADIHISQQIGEYWENVVTRGAGEYRNSNAMKDHHARYGHGVGTGQVDRNDDYKREALRTNLLYLTKDAQSARSGSSAHVRLFGTSLFPRPREVVRQGVGARSNP